MLRKGFEKSLYRDFLYLWTIVIMTIFYGHSDHSP